MQIIAIFLSFFLFQSHSYGKNCRTVQWPFSKNISEIQPSTLQSVSRAHLYKYLYFELSSTVAKKTKGLASKIFYYLKNTELNDDKYQMLVALEWASDLNTSNPRIIPIKEICNIEFKVNSNLSAKKK